MTSKKALKVIEYDLVNDKPVFSEEEHKEAYSVIEKGLEVLEILKKDYNIEVHTFDDEFNDKEFTSYCLWMKSKKTEKVPILIKITKEQYDMLKK